MARTKKADAVAAAEESGIVLTDAEKALADRVGNVEIAVLLARSDQDVTDLADDELLQAVEAASDLERASFRTYLKLRSTIGDKLRKAFAQYTADRKRALRLTTQLADTDGYGLAS